MLTRKEVAEIYSTAMTTMSLTRTGWQKWGYRTGGSMKVNAVNFRVKIFFSIFEDGEMIYHAISTSTIY